jgi:hypothetical protein
VAEHDALGGTGRAGCEEQEGRVGAAAARRFGQHGVAPAGEQVPALLQEVGIAHELRLPIVAHAAILVVDDAAHGRAARQDLQQLVDLFLVLGEDVRRLGALDRRHQLFRRSVGEERRGDRAQPVRGRHRAVEARAVVADQGDVGAALQAALREGGGKGGHLIGERPPCRGLPDAAILLAHRRPLAALAGVFEQQLRKRVRPGVVDRHVSAPRARCATGHGV